MKLAMAQMSMTGSMDENLKRSLAFCDAAAGSDLLFFPEVQLTPFFPQYAGRNVDAYVVPAGSPTVRAFADKARAHGFYLSPNMYLEQDGRSATCKKNDPCVGSPAQGSFLIYIPGTGSGACPDSYARTRWRTPGSRRCRPCSACTRRSSAGGAQRCRCR